MRGVLIAAHGSRAKETEKTLCKVAEMARKKQPDYPIEIGFMEFSEKSIEKGLENLTKQGIDEIKVIPYFLFDGIHIREDIPEVLKKFQEANPGIKIDFGKTMGADERLADIVAEQIENFCAL